MDSILKRVADKIIPSGNTSLFVYVDAIEVINICKEMKCKILGIDSLQLYESGGVRPYMEFSVDYSSPYNYPNSDEKGFWEEAIVFIAKVHTIHPEFIFEIVYDKSQIKTAPRKNS